MEVSSDIQLIRLYKKNKRQTLELLYDRYKKYVYTIAYNYVGGKEAALDITQETFFKLFKAVESIKEEYSVLPYIKKITVNTCLNYIRDHKKEPSLNEKTESGDEIHTLMPSKDNTEGNVIFKDTKRLIEKAIRDLPDEERMAVILRHVKGLKYEEIAKMMHIPLGTVKTYLYRARKTLKDTLSKEEIWEV